MEGDHSFILWKSTCLVLVLVIMVLLTCQAEYKEDEEHDDYEEMQNQEELRDREFAKLTRRQIIEMLGGIKPLPQ